MSNELVKYNFACRAIAACKNADEVKDIRDKGIAMAAYARQAKNKILEIDASEIRIRAERRLGELIAEQRETVGLATGTAGKGRPPLGGSKTDPPKKKPTLADAGIDKHLADRARKLAAVPQKEFEKKLGEWRENVAQESERVTSDLLKIGEREKRDAELKAKKISLPEGKFELFYADPPWKYGNTMPDYFVEQADHYPVMDILEICAMPIGKMATKNAVLFLWVTSPILEESFQVVKAWGFEYKTSFIWDKIKHVMGHYSSVRHEILLLCIRGSYPLQCKKLHDSVVSIERTEHSKKPNEFRKMIESMYPESKKLELFAREKTNGWEVYGNQLSEN